tara:strand:- start:256 stop:555 length:300 start_codon:yes stop_codon:yes gene_type:complete
MDGMANKYVSLILLLLLLLPTASAKEDDVKMTTCRLASQILGNNQRVCVFVGANNTQYREYVPYDAGPCPRQYQCPYRPNKKPFDIKSVVRSIKKQFKN